uniref:hypothetical protein n=1 Tax=Sporosarcina sp. TaxID=49982 RepID=UPI00261F109C
DDTAEVPAEDEEVAEDATNSDDTAEVPAEDEEVVEDATDSDDTTDAAETDEANQTTVWDKLVGYYQQVVTAYDSLFSSLKK